MNQVLRGALYQTSSDRPQIRKSVLHEDLLTRIASRAADYDRDNRFFYEDLEDLRQVKYLLLAVPSELGGLGFSVPEVVAEQARLAYHAGSTALAVNMHLYWTGAAAHLWRNGDHSVDWILREALAGKIFAAGHGEIGNDFGLANSAVIAEPLPDGGYRFKGRKIFTSLSPVWDWLARRPRQGQFISRPSKDRPCLYPPAGLRPSYGRDVGHDRRSRDAW